MCVVAHGCNPRFGRWRHEGHTVNKGQSGSILKRNENQGLATLDINLSNTGLERSVSKVNTVLCCAFWSHLHSLGRQTPVLSGLPHRNDLYPLGVSRGHRGSYGGTESWGICEFIPQSPWGICPVPSTPSPPLLVHPLGAPWRRTSHKCHREPTIYILHAVLSTSQKRVSFKAFLKGLK